MINIKHTYMIADKIVRVSVQESEIHCSNSTSAVFNYTLDVSYTNGDHDFFGYDKKEDMERDLNKIMEYCD